MSNRNEYLKKLLVFGAGFLPSATDIEIIINNNLIPFEATHTSSMVPFKIDTGKDDFIFKQADFLLTTGGMGCSLDSSDYDYKLVEFNSKKYVIAWVIPFGNPIYRKSY